MRPALLLVSLVVCTRLMACKASPTTDPTPPPARSASAPLPKPDAAATGAAGAAGDGALVDLLRATPAVVAVSSNVDNPRDFPEHLVDGKMDTAWNGRTGDLRGWIAFSVPVDATVARIEIAAGYVEGDLFTRNHRLKQVRIARETGATTETLVQATLDPEQRALQPIALPAGARGGRFRIEIQETVPGSESKWRELVVSELRVLGTPGATIRQQPTFPLVTVGALSVPEALGSSNDDYTVHFQETSTSPPPPADWVVALELLGRPSKNVTEFLGTWNRLAVPALAPKKQLLPPGHRGYDAGPIGGGFVANAEVKALHEIVLFGTGTRYELLGVQSSRGFEVSEVPLDHDYYNDPGCFGGTETKLVSARAEPPRDPNSQRGIVVVERVYTWTNSRSFLDENGKTQSLVTPKEVSRSRLECVLPRSATAMRCSSTVVSRACGTVDAPVRCDSY